MARTAKTLIKIQQNGVAVPGFFDTINLGTGLTGTDLGFGVIEFDSAGGGSGITFEVPAGTVDGSNNSFTVANTPKYIVLDGVTYFSGQGYTYVAGTITTDIAPTGFIRSAY